MKACGIDSKEAKDEIKAIKEAVFCAQDNRG